MSDAREWIDELIDELQEERDKLRVRVHLAKMEASEEWEELEEKFEQLQDLIVPETGIERGQIAGRRNQGRFQEHHAPALADPANCRPGRPRPGAQFCATRMGFPPARVNKLREEDRLTSCVEIST